MAAMTAIQAKVLVLDTDRQRAREFQRRLRYLNYESVQLDDADPEPSADDMLAVLITDRCAATDDAAARLRERDPSLPILCLPGTQPNQRVCDGGNVWSLEMPLRRSQLARLLQRAERYRGQERRHRLTGNSNSIRQVRQLIEQVADFDTNVMITGESGTGKELVARTIHDLSDRADMPFVPINCGAIPADLLESELFGHEKGAFTGAITARTGRFELAEGGTLFLDEIGDMSLDMQVKLLRVLQERVFQPIGSDKTRHCDVRIIAATHKDLPRAVESGEFREDLYFRLNVFPIEMPPLYKRVSDLPQLLNELLIQHGGEETGELRVSKEALRVLATYRWPGNIRELSNLVERLAIIKPTGLINVDDLPSRYQQAGPSQDIEPNPVSMAMQLTQTNLKEHLAAIEQELIGQALAATDGVVAKAARMLHMQRTTLVEKIGKYQLH